ncbi:undecaprenyl/decaprenyl-phosphate alpha-N-acetylglucosaminyl 1-phosphate transferase [Pseudohalioglobus sediminis]|uniref:Undecaprenyl/decaprenyl-phosphate alpha-N-acetylglucosaminyl 1-phosphate transferase n=1 Tax=Pseudohalioglobus sediminis TaxID=2606449 RepID=A0A5B0WPQ0_9GAMM|nr:MraY family glycosyltransferase [Pseudohalioglobus sediminis]KAA1188913.1 undecaprenyl/decaprenyl-phosphate alpha-N-acetylglucosaminyl 1-phosphate transferase [Pseudohalioglobus sediminis]
MLLSTLAIASFIIARLCIASAPRLGLVDHPDTRKRHVGAIPLSGGIGIFLTILFGTLFLGIAPYTLPMLVLAFLVFLVGVVDDFRHIHAGARLLIQFGAGALLASYGGIAIYNVGNLLGFGDIHLLMLSVPLSALAVAGLSNAYNMIDGIDGLAASTIALPLLVLFILATLAGHPHASFLLLMLVPLGVFLVFNLGPDNALLPKMFLGDGGSITLGFLVTASLVFFSQGEQALIEPVTALWLVAVPLMDMLATMLRRKRAGRPLMEADRSHLHHALLDRGMGPRRVLLVMLIHAVAAAITGLLLEATPAWFSLFCYFLLFFGHCVFVLRSERLAKAALTASKAAANDALHLDSCSEKAAS